MTANELENELIAGRATLNELLERIRTHIHEMRNFMK